MEKFSHYTSVDFSEDTSFIRWVKGYNLAEDFDWNNWIKNNPEKESLVNEAKNIVQSIQFIPEEIPTHSEDKVWSNIKSNIEKTESTSPLVIPRNKFIRYIPYGIAAAIAIFSLMMYTSENLDTSISTSLAQVETISLPDGSEVIINADSELSYNQKTWEENRFIALKGEAFFKVKKGSQFTVETQYGNVKVLGTSFNVFARENNLRVICESGQVKVSTKKKATILTPNQSISIINGNHPNSEKVNKKESRSNWVSGIFLYDKAALDEVIKDLERQLNVDIKISSNLTKQKYTGSFDSKDKTTALSEVLWPLGLKYAEENNTITVTE